jgi:hypothetical protein
MPILLCLLCVCLWSHPCCAWLKRLSIAPLGPCVRTSVYGVRFDVVQTQGKDMSAPDRHIQWCLYLYSRHILLQVRISAMIRPMLADILCTIVQLKPKTLTSDSHMSTSICECHQGELFPFPPFSDLVAEHKFSLPRPCHIHATLHQTQTCYPSCATMCCHLWGRSASARTPIWKTVDDCLEHDSREVPSCTSCMCIYLYIYIYIYMYKYIHIHIYIYTYIHS